MNEHLACDLPGCKFIAKNPRELHKHFCDRHLSGIVRPSRISELRRIMKGEGATSTGSGHAASTSSGHAAKE